MNRLFPGVFSALISTLFFLSPLVAQAQGPSAAPKEEPILYAPAYVALPTENSVKLNYINGDKPFTGEVRYRMLDTREWQSVPLTMPATLPTSLHGVGTSVTLTGLKPATRYQYELRTEGKTVAEGSGSFMTQRVKAEPFRFVLMTDAHVNPTNPERSPILRANADTAAQNKPDFVMHLGDNIQTIGSGHGGYALESDHPSIFYIYFRQMLGTLQSHAGQAVLNGNWEGENGWHPAENKTWARQARMALAPSPDNTTFPQAGSPNQDYYAFTWGDALFVSLNVTGYNTVDHAHTVGEGSGDTWTLGKEQFAWLEKTLSESKSTWKFLLIHHAVGGNAGDSVNTSYGRGGGRCANVGEQAKIHEMMKKYGVQAFFYGHDHVFTDMAVDGIHYICNGSTGAPWKFTTAETGYENYIPDSGFTVVDIAGDTAHVRYVTSDPAQPLGKELYSVELKASR